jgi:TonB-dependent starch-binding outer membrane protein SusC
MHRLTISSRLVFGLLTCPLTIAAAQGRADSLALSTAVPVAPLVRTTARSWGANVLVIDSAQIARSTAPTLSELLQATLPGVLVMRSGGLASDGSMVMIRGPISMLSSNAPVLIVDGIRVDSRQADNLFNLGAVSPSRLDDVAPEDIERIEVLPGAAAALYGEAAAGAIVVTTKHGAGGPVHFTGRVTTSADVARDEFPANYRRLGTSPTTGQPTLCTLYAVAEGNCTPTSLEVWNPLEQASPFGVGHSALGHLGLRGSALGTGIYAGASGRDREGVLPHDETSRLGFRARLTRDLPGNLAADVFGSYLHDNARMGLDGGYLLNSDVISNALTGTAENDAYHGYRHIAGFPAGDIYPNQWLSHVSGGITLGWHPLPWLEASGTTGRDRALERWNLDDFPPPGSQVIVDQRARSTNELTTSGLQASANYQALMARSTTTVGFERRVARYADKLTPGSFGIVSFRESALASRSSSAFLLQSVELPASVTANASLQHFARSLFGHSRAEWFPTANVSLPVAIRRGGVSEIRLRAAYAEAPAPPPDAAAFQQFLSFPQYFATLANELERTNELEIGVDATLGDRGSLSLTAFRSRARDVPGSNLVFAPNGSEDLSRATIENRGIEGLFRVALLHARGVGWDAWFSVAALRNRVTQLSADVLQSSQALGRLQVGAPLNVPWAIPYTFADANHDGIIDSSEVHLGTAGAVGSPLPTLQTGLGTALHLPKRLTITALVDYEHGNTMIDQMGEYRCELYICRGIDDPSAPLAEQAAAEAAVKALFLPVTGFVEDGSFLKLREVAVHWQVARAWSHYFGDNAELTLAGRNLITATSYGGSDPEISSGQPSVLPRREFARLPTPREFILRIDFRT